MTMRRLPASLASIAMSSRPRSRHQQVLKTVIVVSASVIALRAGATSWTGAATSTDHGVLHPRRVVASLMVGSAGVSTVPLPVAGKRPEGVNRPELLPKTPGEKVIDVARILSDRQKREIVRLIDDIEAGSKLKLRVLAQTYPNSPGLAIKDYWNVDTCKGPTEQSYDKTCLGDPTTLVYVHDTGGLGNAVVNFAVGREVEAVKPMSFWRQLQNKYGNTFYIQEHGDSDTVVDVVSALKEALVPPPPQSPSAVQ